MKYLAKGMESKKLIDLLLSLTKINSDSIKAAIQDHLVSNFSISDAASLNNVNQCNLTRSILTLNKVARKVELINELKLCRVSDLSK